MIADDLSPRERRIVNDELAHVMKHWHANTDLDFVMLCQALNEVAARSMRTIRDNKDTDCA